MQIKTAILSGAKVLAATAVVWAAGLAVISFSNRGGESIDIGVQEAEADIWGLTFADRSKHESFIKVLEETGMEQPREYDWNGNRVFFSTMTTSQSPRSSLRAFQDEFVRKGVNQKAHYDRPGMKNIGLLEQTDVTPGESKAFGDDIGQFMAWQDDFWGGGVVPMVGNDDHFQMMGGTSGDGESDSALDVVSRMTDKGANYNHGIKAMRYVDAYREGPNRTRITAIWSDEDLDLMKFANKEKYEDKTYNTSTVPACAGCERKMRFKGKGAENSYASNIDEGTQNPDAMIDYYDRALRNRGWQKSDSTRIMQEARTSGIMPNDIGQILVYSRGKDFITVTAQPTSENKTLVQIMEMP
jgi:hypothetical protein